MHLIKCDSPKVNTVAATFPNIALDTPQGSHLPERLKYIIRDIGRTAPSHGAKESPQLLPCCSESDNFLDEGEACGTKQKKECSAGLVLPKMLVSLRIVYEISRLGV